MLLPNVLESHFSLREIVYFKTSYVITKLGQTNGCGKDGLFISKHHMLLPNAPFASA